MSGFPGREVLWAATRRTDVFVQCSGVSCKAHWLTLNPHRALLVEALEDHLTRCNLNNLAIALKKGLEDTK